MAPDAWAAMGALETLIEVYRRDEWCAVYETDADDTIETVAQ
jgi:hypothetical protein